MKRSPGAVLALYLVALFLALPFTPRLATALTARLGAEAITGPLTAAALLLAAVCVRRLASRGASSAGRLLFLAALGAAFLLSWRYLASSPIGRFHLLEYGLLGVLMLRALPGPPGRGRYLGAFLGAAFTGVVDEIVQYYLPNRVYDPWDVALNAAASLLGVAAAWWWRWTAPGPVRQ